jgi:hypothetical protein
MQLGQWQGFVAKPAAAGIEKAIYVAVAVLTLFFFGFVYVIKKGPKPWSNLEVLLVRPIEVADAPSRKPPQPEKPQAKTLRERFETDFGGSLYVVELTTDIELSDGTRKLPPLEVNERIYFDWGASQSRFVTFYVPASTMTEAYCAYLLDARVGALLNIADNNVKAQFHSLGERQRDIAETRFAGGVFIYHEESLNHEAVARLAKLAASKKLNVRLRGPFYEIAQNLYDRSN